MKPCNNKVGISCKCAMPGCKKWFTKKHWNQRYCNHKCSMAAEQLKARKRHRDTYKPAVRVDYKQKCAELQKELDRALEALDEHQLIQLGYCA